MSETYEIALFAVLALGLYYGAKGIRCLLLLWPDKQGVKVHETTWVKGRNILDEPLVYPLAAVELHNALAPKFLFFKDTLDPEILKEALADCLDETPMFGGRIQIDRENNRAQVIAENKGLPVKVQSLTGHNIEDYHRNAPYLRGASTYRIPLFVDRLRLEKMMKGEEPFARFVITQFETGGTALGMNFSHIVFDAVSEHQFLAMWAQRCQLRTQGLKEPLPPYANPPSTERTEFLKACGVNAPSPTLDELEKTLAIPLSNGSLGLCTPKGMRKAMINFFRRFMGVDDRHLILNYSADELGALKKAACAGCKEGEWLSTNDALCAHVWQLVTKLQQRDPMYSKNKTGPSRSLYVAVNARPFLAPEAEPSLIGNVIIAVASQEDSDTLLSDGTENQLNQIATRLRATLKTVTPHYVRSVIQWMEKTHPNPVEKVPMTTRGYLQFNPGDQAQFLISVARSSEINYFTHDFGSGTPQWGQPQSCYGAALVGHDPNDPSACDLHLTFAASTSIEDAVAVKQELFDDYMKMVSA